jgi:hypothetical protein
MLATSFTVAVLGEYNSVPSFTWFFFCPPNPRNGSSLGQRISTMAPWRMALVALI